MVRLKKSMFIPNPKRLLRVFVSVILLSQPLLCANEASKNQLLTSEVYEDPCEPEDHSADIPAHCTEEVAVKLGTTDPKEAETVAQKHGFHSYGQIGGMEGYFHFEHVHKHVENNEHIRRKRKVASEKLSSDSNVEWISGQRIKKRVKRDYLVDNNSVKSKRELNLPWPDPLYQDQWFLHKGASGGYDMWITEAWKLGYSGRGASVSILDDGIQTDHPDLKDNYDPEASTDVNGKDSDPYPQNNGDNKHGTRCAGEVAAVAGNKVCGVGVAYNAKIGGVRMLDGPVSDRVEAASLSHNQNHIDVYSASWGPEDDGRTFDGPGPLAKQAFINGITKGRGGLGNIFIWASGNGGAHQDSCSCDGYTTSIYTLSVSAATVNNGRPWYLEECPSTIATTYSSGGAGEKAIVTVDMPNSCTKYHTGTSASAPMAAGVVALALEANRNLTWRDMQHVVLRTATPTALLANPGWTKNGVGRQVSNKFGYGIMNAEALVRLSRKWKTVPEQHSCTYDYKMTGPIPKPLTGKFVETYSMEVKGCEESDHPVLYLEQLQVVVTIRFSRRGDLNIFLQSPMGTRSELLPKRRGDANASGFHKWPFLSVQQWGEDPRGTWTITIENGGSAQNTGSFHGWSLLLYGTAEPAQSGDPVHPSVPHPSVPHTHVPGKTEETSQLESAAHPTNKATMYQNCHSECVTEEGCKEAASATACIKCKHYRQNLRNRGGVRCVASCVENYYTDENTKTCKQCLKTCKTCSGPDTCTSCQNMLVMSDLGHFHHGQCVDTCPEGYQVDIWQMKMPPKKFKSPEKRKEEARGQRARSRDAESPEKRQKRLEDERLRTAARIETEDEVVRATRLEDIRVRSAAARESDPSQTQCKIPCSLPNCASCRKASVCEKCVSGFYLTNVGSCTQTCNPGTYPDHDAGVCRNCVYSCDLCVDKDSCGACARGTEWNDALKACKAPGGCSSTSCQGGHFCDTTTGVCRLCHGACQTCTGPKATACSKCADRNLIEMRSGKCTCKKGYYFDAKITSCDRCEVSCGSCDEWGRSHCVECADGYRRSDVYCTKCCLPGENPSRDSCMMCISSADMRSPSTPFVSRRWFPLVVGLCVAVVLLFFVLFGCLMCRENGYQKLGESEWDVEDVLQSKHKPSKNGVIDSMDSDDDDDGDTLFPIQH